MIYDRDLIRKRVNDKYNAEQAANSFTTQLNQLAKGGTMMSQWDASQKFWEIIHKERTSILDVLNQILHRN